METRHPLPRMRLPLPALLVLFAVACGDLVEPEAEPVGIDVQGPTERLTMGQTVRLVAAIRFSAGRPAGAIPVRWVSRDPTTATVDSTGTVTGVLSGEAWVVATAGAFTDSAVVEVAFPLAPGEGRMRLRTDRTDRVVVLPEPAGMWFDYLSRTQEDFSWIAAENGSSTDTVLVLVLPTRPATGRTPLTAWHPSLLDTLSLDAVSAPLAFLMIEEPYPNMLVVPLGGWVDLAIVDAPPGPGTRLGMLRARMVLEGETYRGTPGVETPVWTSTGQAHGVVADMLPVYQHWAVGTSAGQVSGVPRPATWETREAWWGPSWKGSANRLDVEDGPPDLSVDIYGVVSAPIGSVLRADQAVLQIDDWDAGYFASASDGRVEITRYVSPPASDLFGEVQGRVQARGTGTGSLGNAFAFEASFDFHAPVFPERYSSGVPRALRVGGSALGRIPGVAALMERVGG